VKSERKTKKTKENQEKTKKTEKTEETPTKSNFDSGKIKCSKSGQY
jgi:hypothetical protein